MEFPACIFLKIYVKVKPGELKQCQLWLILTFTFLFQYLIYPYQSRKIKNSFSEIYILRFCKPTYWLQILLLAAEYLHLDFQTLIQLRCYI